MIDYLPIIAWLNISGYDYLNKPKGDGVTDDGPIIQARAFAARFNSGISALDGIDGSNFMIKGAIHLNGSETLNDQNNDRKDWA